jgi:flagellin
MKDNTDMAKGRITDADFASESANMSKNSMLMQSGISMLKQAGQMPSMVMSLLG